LGRWFSKNTFGINISGTIQNLTIKNNIFDNLFNANALVLSSNGIKENVNINNNRFSFIEYGGALIRVIEDLNGILL
jgi:hypothetical protein